MNNLPGRGDYSPKETELCGICHQKFDEADLCEVRYSDHHTDWVCPYCIDERIKDLEVAGTFDIANIGDDVWPFLIVFQENRADIMWFVHQAKPCKQCGKYFSNPEQRFCLKCRVMLESEKQLYRQSAANAKVIAKQIMNRFDAVDVEGKQ